MAIFERKTVTIEGEYLTLKEIRELARATDGLPAELPVLNGELQKIDLGAFVVETKREPSPPKFNLKPEPPHQWRNPTDDRGR